jgi:hypothetical protein
MMLQSQSSIKAGLDFISAHVPEPPWPRCIFTPIIKQQLVYDEEEAVTRFIQANLLDCRMNVYADYTAWHGMNRQAPCTIYCDLDNVKALDIVLKRFKEMISGVPTVVNSGCGLQIIQPVKAVILEDLNIFDAFVHLQPSNLFLKFAERYLSNGLSLA